MYTSWSGITAFAIVMVAAAGFAQWVVTSYAYPEVSGAEMTLWALAAGLVTFAIGALVHIGEKD